MAQDNVKAGRFLFGFRKYLNLFSNLPFLPHIDFLLFGRPDTRTKSPQKYYLAKIHNEFFPLY
jgi:hypothetical protein